MPDQDFANSFCKFSLSGIISFSGSVNIISRVSIKTSQGSMDAAEDGGDEGGPDVAGGCDPGLKGP